MRDPLPQINPTLQGEGAGPTNVISAGQSDQWVLDPDYLWSLGVRRVRIGGTDPAYSNATQAGKDNALQYKARGFYVELGMTFVNRTGTQAGKFGVEDQAQYLADAVAFATWCQTNGIDTFMMQNEMSALLDTTTLSQQDFRTWIITVLYPACQAVAPDVRMAINEVGSPSMIAAWAAEDLLGQDIKLGFNIYGANDTDLAGFTAQAQAVKAIPTGYISEWAIHFTWASASLDPYHQRDRTAERKAVLDSLGLEHYHFTFKRTNTNDAGDWNAFGAMWSIGVPNSPSGIFYKRKMFDAIFPERDLIGGAPRNWLNFNGTSAYALCPIVPSGAGILVMFWINRQEYASAEKYVIGNFNPALGGLQSFRLFHDAPTSGNPSANRDVALNTFNDTSSGGFSVINALSAGDDQHVAIYITPRAEGANLYINNRRMPNKPSGFIGDPVQSIVIGARAGDFFGKSKMRMRGLVIKNVPTTNRDEAEALIAAHYNHPDTYGQYVPAGASWYDFNLGPADQSGNGNHLQLVNTTYYTEEIPTARDVSEIRPISSSRSAVA